MRSGDQHPAAASHGAHPVGAHATADADESGPVNGRFTVTQSAISATDTIVSYAVAGTATPGGTDYATLDADDQRVAAARAQLGEACPSSELLAAEHAAAVSGQDVEHRPLLSRQALEGVSCC